MAQVNTQHISVGVKPPVKLKVLNTPISVDLWKSNWKQAVSQKSLLGFLDFLIHHNAASIRQFRCSKFFFRMASLSIKENKVNYV